MDRALFWAERGRGRTSPNPIVGAVVVDADGRVVGQGAHMQAGGPHAEVHALAAAGARAAGATLYCTLEPCCHVGRTGPCVERILEAGIRTVVAALRDPNPRVAGKGFAFLREHGVEVRTGTGARAAADQNRPFFTWIQHHRPYVIAKTAVSADGFVGRPGARVKLTGDEADRWFHRQRAEIDAIAVGAGTVVADDPWLTARLVYRVRPLARVVFDWRLRIPPAARVLSTLSAGPGIMITTRAAAEQHAPKVDALMAQGVEVERLDTRDLAAGLARLAARGILSLLVEGGPALQAALADAGLIDRVQCVRTPHVLGDGVEAAAFVRRLDWTNAKPLGADALIEFDLRPPVSGGAG
jgi:diaminohydroxyphosphoribosylaminopyrimidine deaminase/5-amino-6-(5-phosphoribosylamino)uracil reductase